MRITLSKNIFYQILFALCVTVPYLNNYELTFVVWSFTAVLSLQKKYNSRLVIQVLCFSLIFGIAFFSSFFNEYKTYDFVRDITYLAKPILGLLIGYQLCKTHIKNPLKTAINTGILLAVIHLLIVIYGLVIVSLRDIHQIRSYAGFFSDFEVVVIVLLLFSKELDIQISSQKKSLFLLILVVSSLFYLSRTNFIEFAILVLAMKGFFVISKRKIIGLSIVLLSGLLFYSAILYYNPKRNGKGIEAFLYKVKIAPTEPFKTKINVDDYKDFNDNYRSVENINTVKQVKNEGGLKVFIGKGLGSKVDLKKEVLLDSTKLRYISVLHNGFMTIFLKSGIIGVFILLFTILILFKKQNTGPPIIKNINFLIIGFAVFMFISYWVFMGFYFKADTKSILLGLFFALSESLSKKAKTVSSASESI
jgi:hypothetical protein